MTMSKHSRVGQRKDLQRLKEIEVRGVGGDKKQPVLVANQSAERRPNSNHDMSTRYETRFAVLRCRGIQCDLEQDSFQFSSKAFADIRTRSQTILSITDAYFQSLMLGLSHHAGQYDRSGLLVCSM